MDDILNLIFRIGVNGIKHLRNNIKLLIVDIILILLIYITRQSIYYYIFFGLFIISAIKEEIKTVIKNKKIAYYNRIFTECKLYSSEHITPVFLYEEKRKKRELNIMEIVIIAAIALIIFIIYKTTKNKEQELIYKQEQLKHTIEAEQGTELKNKRSYYQFIFEQCKLSATKDRSPIYLAEKQINSDETAIVFSSLIPLSDWQEKKSELEEYLELKIVNLEQLKNNNSNAQSLSKIIKMTVTNKSLASRINWNDNFINQKTDVLNIGFSYKNIIGMNLEIYPHAFIAGTTGSGKTNLLQCLIHQALMKGFDVVLIDFKRGVSFMEFENRVKIYYEYDTTEKILLELVAETKKRLDIFREHRIDNLKKYNESASKKLKRKIIFIDELAELLTVSDKKQSAAFYDCIETLTRISRAAGINLIMATQRVDSTIINGQIKSNVIFRVCGALPDVEASRIMLGNNMAYKISPELKGRVIVKSDDFYEVQSFYYEAQTNNNFEEINEENEKIEYTIPNSRQKEIAELKNLKKNLIELKSDLKEPTIDFDFDEF